MNKTNRRGIGIGGAALILTVLVAVLLGTWRLHTTHALHIRSNLEDATVSFAVRDLDDRLTLSWNEGDQIRLAAGRRVLGTLAGGITSSPSESEGLHDLTGSFRAIGEFDSGRFYVRGAASIVPGMTLAVESPQGDFTIEILDIEPVDR